MFGCQELIGEEYERVAVDDYSEITSTAKPRGSYRLAASRSSSPLDISPDVSAVQPTPNIMPLSS